MFKKDAFIGLLAAVLVWGSFGAAPTAAQTPDAQRPAMRRFALVTGSNGGAIGQARLRYAASDARSFSAVLTELGGVSKDDMILLIDPTIDRLRDSLRRMRASVARAAAEGQRCEFILYYSGHSDESGLELGAERYGYANLRNDMEQVGAEVQLAIVDSCSSGSLTRAKGGTARPAFLFDASAETKGHAYLTSSSADESAQESDRLGGSFFTHYLISGMRGAADLDGRGLVTLNEAYAFAFKETLASTENTRFGPQHPAYDIHLTGSGDLVLTDLRSYNAGLSLAKDIDGRLYVRDARGNLAVEIEKKVGGVMTIGLEAGSYTVFLERGEAHFGCSVSIADGRWTELASSDFQRRSAEATLPRGGDGEEVGARTTAFSIGIIPDLSAGLLSSNVDRNVSINAIAGSSGSVAGFEASGLWNSDSRRVSGFQVAGLGNIVAGGASACQIAGFANYVGRDVQYAQIAGFGNLAGGATAGAQVAGFCNLTLGDATGAQVAGAFNYAREGVRGLQLAGLANAAAAVDGAQVGLVNVGGVVRGAQVGLVNVAQELHGLPIGLLSLERGGIRAVEASWAGSGSPATLGLKLGTRHSYTLFSVGAYMDADPNPWHVGLGLGGRIGEASAAGGVEALFLDIDLSTKLRLGAGDSNSLDQSAELRAEFGLPLGGVTLMIGGALDYALPKSGSALLRTAQSGEGLVPRLSFGLQL